MVNHGESDSIFFAGSECFLCVKDGLYIMGCSSHHSIERDSRAHYH